MTRAPCHSLGANDAEQYQRDGYFVRASCFSDAELNDLRNAAESAAARAGRRLVDGRAYVLDGKRFVDVDHVTIQMEHDSGSRAIRVIEPVHDLDERLADLARDRRLVEPMRGLVGTPAVTLWTDKLNLKRPRQGSGFGWHQDAPYWIHDCPHVDRLPNVMVAFDDATRANGCFKVVRGSHRNGCLPGTDDGSQLGGFYTDPGSFDAHDEVSLEVAAGSLIFFDPFIVHGSEPNTSDLPRRAMVLTYQPAGFPMLKSGRVMRL
ncbi:MAG: phytanoyl-CoA dioxygenase family protein [Pseudomonadales bacterium]